MITSTITAPEQTEPPLRVIKQKDTEPLRECVRDALHSYFDQLNGHSASPLYQLVIREVEQPLFETVMEYTGGNQTRAASLLGISRSTLRKKLSLYHIE
ncbi:MAG TPA: DNA-binding transcriptional regulator Fis [Chromatiaceae bacterium]|nr:DNA-binding transcriptional regulator Fis [Chromatiaceae bacterium]